MAKVVTTLEICESAKLARDLALTGEIFLELVRIWENVISELVMEVVNCDAFDDIGCYFGVFR